MLTTCPDLSRINNGADRTTKGRTLGPATHRVFAAVRGDIAGYRLVVVGQRSRHRSLVLNRFIPGGNLIGCPAIRSAAVQFVDVGNTAGGYDCRRSCPAVGILPGVLSNQLGVPNSQPESLGAGF